MNVNQSHFSRRHPSVRAFPWQKSGFALARADRLLCPRLLAGRQRSWLEPVASTVASEGGLALAPGRRHVFASVIGYFFTSAGAACFFAYPCATFCDPHLHYIFHKRRETSPPLPHPAGASFGVSFPILSLLSCRGLVRRTFLPNARQLRWHCALRLHW